MHLYHQHPLHPTLIFIIVVVAECGSGNSQSVHRSVNIRLWYNITGLVRWPPSIHSPNERRQRTTSLKRVPSLLLSSVCIGDWTFNGCRVYEKRITPERYSSLLLMFGYRNGSAYSSTHKGLCYGGTGLFGFLNYVSITHQFRKDMHNRYARISWRRSILESNLIAYRPITIMRL